MITNHAVLQPDVQPDREIIVHRRCEIETLTQYLEPLTTGTATTGLYVHGPSGAGKTCTTRCVLAELASVADVPVARLDCIATSGRREILNQVLEALGAGPAGLRQGVGTDCLSVRLRNEVDGPMVVVLDEVDHVDDLAVLQELYEIPQVTLVVIANNPWSGLERVTSPRLDSRFGSLPTLAFQPYAHDELVSILERRVAFGVRPGCVDRDVLEYLVAGSDDADARRCLGLLYEALQVARERDADRLERCHVDSAVLDTEVVVRAVISALSREQRVALEAIVVAGPGTSTELYEAYERRVETPKSKRTFDRWRGRFEDDGLLERRGRADRPQYVAVGAVESVLGLETVLG